MLDTRMEEGQISVYDRLTFARSRNVGPQAIVAHSSCLRRSDNLNLANNQSTIYLVKKEVVECIFSWSSAAWIRGRRMSRNRSCNMHLSFFYISVSLPYTSLWYQAVRCVLKKKKKKIVISGTVLRTRPLFYTKCNVGQWSCERVRK